MDHFQKLGHLRALRDLGLLKLGSLPGGLSPAAFKAMVRGGETTTSRAAAAAPVSAAVNPFRPIGKGAVPVVMRPKLSPFEQGIGARIVPGFEHGAAGVTGSIGELGGKLPPQAAAQGSAAPATGLKARLQAALPQGGAPGASAAPALPASPPNAFKARLQAALPQR